MSLLKQLFLAICLFLVVAFTGSLPHVLARRPMALPMEAWSLLAPVPIRPPFPYLVVLS